MRKILNYTKGGAPYWLDMRIELMARRLRNGDPFRRHRNAMSRWISAGWTSLNMLRIAMC